MPNIDFSQNTPMESSGIFRDDDNPKITRGHRLLLAILLLIGLVIAGIFFL